MSYRTDTESVVNFLNKKASEGFLSEPVPSQYDASEFVQKVNFSNEDKKQVRAYLAKYHSVLTKVDYPMGSFFGEEGQRTAPLSQMLNHMLCDSGPEYVSANATRLAAALDSHKQFFDALAFEQEFA